VGVRWVIKKGGGKEKLMGGDKRGSGNFLTTYQGVRSTRKGQSDAAEKERQVFSLRFWKGRR